MEESLDVKLKRENLEYEQIINELKERWDVEKMLMFNETNIQEKLQENSLKVFHFTEMYQKELNEYNKILEIKDKITTGAYLEIKKNQQYILKQTEIEKYYLPNHPKVIEITEIARKQKWKVDFYQGVKQALEKQGWSIHNFLNSMKAGL